MKYKSFLAGAVSGLVVLGLGTGVMAVQKKIKLPGILRNIKVFGSTVIKPVRPQATVIGSESPMPGCQEMNLTTIGVSGCWPSDWVKTSEEGPKGIVLGEIVWQSPDFKIFVDQGSSGQPAIRIKSGYQLSIKATRLTMESEVATMADLKAFWESNRVSAGIAREEETIVGGQPALYDFLSTPKEGGQISTHLINNSLLYDFNFYYSDGQDGKGENLYSYILGKINLEAVDPKMEENSEKVAVTPLSTITSVGMPETLTITKEAGLEIASQSEVPTVVTQSKASRRRTVLGTALPQGDGVNQPSYILVWTPQVVGTYEVVAEVIKDNGMIYESIPAGITVNPGKATPTASVSK